MLRGHKRRHWVHVHPRAEKKIWGQNLQEKVVSAPPRQSKGPIFRKFGALYCGSGVNLVVLACVLRATTKKVFFGQEKCIPHKKILAMPMFVGG